MCLLLTCILHWKQIGLDLWIRKYWWVSWLWPKRSLVIMTWAQARVQVPRGKFKLLSIMLGHEVKKNKKICFLIREHFTMSNMGFHWPPNSPPWIRKLILGSPVRQYRKQPKNQFLVHFDLISRTFPTLLWPKFEFSFFFFPKFTQYKMHAKIPHFRLGKDSEIYSKTLL